MVLNLAKIYLSRFFIFSRYKSWMFIKIIVSPMLNYFTFLINTSTWFRFRILCRLCTKLYFIVKTCIHLRTEIWFFEITALLTDGWIFLCFSYSVIPARSHFFCHINDWTSSVTTATVSNVLIVLRRISIL